MTSHNSKALIFDIETVGENFDQMDEVTQHALTRAVRENSKSEAELQDGIEAVRQKTSLSPLTGQIVAIGVLAGDSDKGAVYYQAPGQEGQELKHEGIKLAAMSEPEMLERFWHVVKSCRQLVGFNSRGFDAFHINIRSAIHGIRPSVDLMSNRYLGSQRAQVQHIDLLDQLKYYGAVWGSGLSLHMWCRAFGISSPKDSGVDGSQVGKLFADARYEDIARYNIDDLYATRELYRAWDKYLNFQ
jgi:hypothetical protein